MIGARLLTHLFNFSVSIAKTLEFDLLCSIIFLLENRQRMNERAEDRIYCGMTAMGDKMDDMK